MKCVVCGKNNVKILRHQRTLAVQFGSMQFWPEIVHSCNNCGSEIQGDDQPLVEAIENSTCDAIKNLLDFFDTQGHKPINIERILGIPFHSLKRKKNYRLSYCILKFAKMHPEILENEKFYKVIYGDDKKKKKGNK